MFRHLHRWLTEKPKPLVQPHHPSKVEFLAEHDGLVERQLKARWTSILQTHPTARRAYLAQVRLSEARTPSVALAVITTNGVDAALMGKLAAEFKTLMASSQFVDILFSSEAQETQLARVCKAFYAA
jgi:SseB protein C-terminal domain